MSDFKIVKHRRKVKSGGHFKRKSRVDTLLNTFKIEECPSKDHSVPLCPKWHSETDRCRNPFKTYYDLYEAKNSVEKRYHPLILCTKMCEKKKSCQFGSLCSKAHDYDELRDPENIEYKRDLNMNSLGDFADSITKKRMDEPIPVPSITRNPTSAQISKKHGPLNDTDTIILSNFQQFVLQCNQAIWKTCVTESQKNLCKMELIHKFGHVKIIVSGANSRKVSEKIQDLLKGPPCEKNVALYESIKVDGVVLKQIQKDLNKNKLRFDQVRIWNPKQKDLSNKEDHTSVMWIDIDVNSEVLSLYEVIGAKSKTSRLGYVMEEVDSWIKHNNYKSATCEACCDAFLDKHGVSCPNGHFFCIIEDDCFTSLLESQKASIQSQKAELRCPICDVAFKEQDVAKVVPHNTWKDLFNTIIDAKIGEKYEEMSREFDDRVRSKVEELINQYASSDDQGKIKLEAKMKAKDVRTNALNLSCPLCQAVYSEFDGCMALVCASCKGNFCGFCHKGEKGRTASVAHTHVRNCVDNNTRNGSYFATKHEIKDAQRRYRIKKLKTILAPMTKDLQNAVVIELKGDLNDLDIDPAALLDLGNLHQELLDHP